MRKTDNEILVAALRILSRDIVTDDGVANSCIAEAAYRIEELDKEVRELKLEMLDIQCRLD